MMRNSYIAHHGVKGQRHGIRRWQNLDGSLTPAGYIHYGIHPREPKALNRDGSLTEYGKKRFNDAWDRSDAHRTDVDYDNLVDYAKSLPEFENAVQKLSNNEWAKVRKQLDAIWRQPDYDSDPLYAAFKEMVLEKNRKDPEYAGMTDDQIIYERNHHFEQDIEIMIQDHLLATKGLNYDQVRAKNRAIAEAAASSIANKTLGDVRDWEFVHYMATKIHEKADERIWNPDSEISKEDKKRNRKIAEQSWMITHDPIKAKQNFTDWNNARRTIQDNVRNNFYAQQLAYRLKKFESRDNNYWTLVERLAKDLEPMYFDKPTREGRRFIEEVIVEMARS